MGHCWESCHATQNLKQLPYQDVCITVTKYWLVLRITQTVVYDFLIRISNVSNLRIITIHFFFKISIWRHQATNWNSEVISFISGKTVCHYACTCLCRYILCFLLNVKANVKFQRIEYFSMVFLFVVLYFFQYFVEYADTLTN